MIQIRKYVISNAADHLTCSLVISYNYTHTYARTHTHTHTHIRLYVLWSSRVKGLYMRQAVEILLWMATVFVWKSMTVQLSTSEIAAMRTSCEEGRAKWRACRRIAPVGRTVINGVIICDGGMSCGNRRDSFDGAPGAFSCYFRFGDRSLVIGDHDGITLL